MQFKPDVLKTEIVEYFEQPLSIKVTKNSTEYFYNINDCIIFKDHKFKIDHIVKRKQLDDNYIEFIIKGYLWLEDNWDINLSYFYSINSTIVYYNTLRDSNESYEIDWRTINLTENPKNCESHRGGTFRKRHKNNKTLKFK